MRKQRRPIKIACGIERVQIIHRLAIPSTEQPDNAIDVQCAFDVHLTAGECCLSTQRCVEVGQRNDRWFAGLGSRRAPRKVQCHDVLATLL